MSGKKLVSLRWMLFLELVKFWPWIHQWPVLSSPLVILK